MEYLWWVMLVLLPALYWKRRSNKIALRRLALGTRMGTLRAMIVQTRGIIWEIESSYPVVREIGIGKAIPKLTEYLDQSEHSYSTCANIEARDLKEAEDTVARGLKQIAMANDLAASYHCALLAGILPAPPPRPALPEHTPAAPPTPVPPSPSTHRTTSRRTMRPSSKKDPIKR